MIDKTDMHTLIYDTSMLSKNTISDMCAKSALKKEYLSDDEQNYADESKSDMFNPMIKG